MTTYTKYGVSLTKNQKDSLRAAVNAKRPVTLRLAHNQLSGSDQLLLTRTQIQKIQKARLSAKGVDIKLSKTQLGRTGGALASLLGFALPMLLPSLLGSGVQLPGTRGRGLQLPGTRKGGAVTDAVIRNKARQMGYKRVVKGSGIWSFIKGLFT